VSLLREYIRGLLRETSVLPTEQYKFPIIPYPQRGSPEAARDLARVIHQTSNRVVPEDLQDACDTDMQSLFEDYLVSKGLTYNLSYYEKLMEDLGPVIHTLKEFYNRPRPGDEAKKLGLPPMSDDLTSANSPSYPSGHTIQAYVIALLLAEQFPDESNGLLSIAEMVAQSRVDRGVHFPSDIDFGRRIAYLIVEEMLGEHTT